MLSEKFVESMIFVMSGPVTNEHVALHVYRVVVVRQRFQLLHLFVEDLDRRQLFELFYYGAHELLQPLVRGGGDGKDLIPLFFAMRF